MKQENLKNKLAEVNKESKGVITKRTKNNLLIRSKKEAKGITLIALVITIIVLLILAGVTIATLLGDNGIITRATTAKDKTREAGAVERVQVEVAGSYGTDGNIDIDELNKNLQSNIPDLTLNGQPISDENKIDKLPVNVTLDGYNIVINGDGVVEKIPELTAKIIENPKEYYGKKVTNYKDDENTYRIFYVDTENYFGDGANTIYLKADYSAQNYDINNNYEQYDKEKTKVRQMNPDWAKARGASENEWNINEKAAAYLCSPVDEKNKESKTELPWNSYYDSSAANYVIGGPSVEMYVKSYNEAYEGENSINGHTIYELGANYRETASPGYIYTLNGTQSTVSNDDYCTGNETNDTLDYTKYDSMYCGKDGSKTGSWWLPSPSANSNLHVCHVTGYNAYLTRAELNANYAVSPLISLKSDFVLEVEN